jgi:hypothetical protein
VPKHADVRSGFPRRRPLRHAAGLLFAIVGIGSAATPALAAPSELGPAPGTWPPASPGAAAGVLPLRPLTALPRAVPTADDPLVVATPVYAPLGDVSQAAAATQPVTLQSVLSPADAAAARATALGALAPTLSADPRLAAGAGGALTAMFPTQLTGETTISAVRATIALPAAYRVGQLAAPGWRCIRTARRVACAAPGSRAAGALAPIRIGLIARAARAGGGPAPATLQASWRQAPGATDRYRAEATLPLTARRPLRVALATERDRVLAPTAGEDDPAPVVVTGHLAGMRDGMPVTVAWQQVCGRPGAARPCRDDERIRFATPTRTTAGGADVAAQVVLAPRTRAGTVRLRLTASDWRGTSADTLALRVLPTRSVRLDPQLDELRGITALRPPARRSWRTGHAVDSPVVRTLQITGTAAPRPGARVRLVARAGAGSTAGRVRWSIVRGPRRALAGAVRSGSALTFRAPRRGSLVVQATARVSGTVVRDRHAVFVRPAATPRHRRAGRRAAARAVPGDTGTAPASTPGAGGSAAAPDADDDPEAADEPPAGEAPAEPFCPRFRAAADGDAGAGTDDDPIDLGSGVSVTLAGATAKGADCSAADAAVAFTAATLKLGRLSLSDVRGTLTADGLWMTDGWLVVPAAWTDLLGAARQRYHVQAPGRTAVGAAIRDGAWAPFAGRLVLEDGLPWLPLPDGWDFTPNGTTIELQPSRRALALRSQAAPDVPQTRTSVAFVGEITYAGTASITVTGDRVVDLQGTGEDAVALSGAGRVQITRAAEAEAPDPAAPAEPAEPADADAPTDADADADAAPAAKTAGGYTLSGSVSLRTDPADQALTVAQGLTVTGAQAIWDADGFSLGGTVSIATGSGPLTGTVAGVFQSRSSWKLEVRQTDGWELQPGIELSDVHGTVERRPAAAPEAGGDADPATADAGPDGDAGGQADDPKAEDARADADDPEPAAAPDAPAQPLPDVVTASIGGTVRGWSPSPSLSDLTVTGEISNRCADDEPTCTTDRVRLRLALSGEAKIPSVADPLKWKGAAVVTLRTMAVRFDAGARLARLGPDDLGLRDVDVRLSNQGPRWCVAAGTATTAATPPSPADPTTPGDAADGFTEIAPKLAATQGLALGFRADGRAFGQSFTAFGEFSRAGYCLAADFRRFQPPGTADAGGADDSLFRSTQLLYASRAVEIKADPQRRPIALAAGQVKLVAAFAVPASRLPASMRDSLAGEGEFTATLTRTGAPAPPDEAPAAGAGADAADAADAAPAAAPIADTGSGYAFHGEVTYRLAKPAYLIGSADPRSTALTLGGITLSVDYSPGSALRIALAAEGALTTPAGADVPASTTPLAVTASISLGKLALGVSAAVDASKAPGGVVRNAFGQAGLDVRSLQVAGTIGATYSLGLSADATLPASWSSSLGVQARVRAVVALNVDAVSPCVEIAVDARDPQPGAATAGPAAIRLGPVTASYARVVIAPTGCTIGAGATAYTIDPGFALAFQGTVAATPVDLSAKLTRRPSGSFAVQASADVGAFTLGTARFEQTRLRLDLDSEARRFLVEVRGGLRVGDGFVTVDGALEATPQRFTGHLRGAGDVVLGGTSFGRARIDASVDALRGDSGWTLRQLAVDGSADVLGVSTDLSFAYADGRLREAAGALDVRGGVGPAQLGAGGLIAYRPDGARLSGTTCRFRGDGAATITPDPRGKQLFLRLCGSLALGPLQRQFTWDEAFPKTIDFDLRVPRLEMSVYVARVYAEGSLNASLELSPTKPRFWIRGGRAVAGGCVGIGWFAKCGDGVNVTFIPRSGRFEGTFIGIPVAWGSDEWRVPA